LEAAREAFARINGVLDLAPDREIHDPELAGWVEARIRDRREARARRDFAEADRIRGELSERGIAVEDTAGGTKWKRVR
jgi:cysteinyl-tRNA synthetase